MSPAFATRTNQTRILKRKTKKVCVCVCAYGPRSSHPPFEPCINLSSSYWYLCCRASKTWHICRISLEGYHPPAQGRGDSIQPEATGWSLRTGISSLVPEWLSSASPTLILLLARSQSRIQRQSRDHSEGFRPHYPRSAGFDRAQHTR